MHRATIAFALSIALPSGWAAQPCDEIKDQDEGMIAVSRARSSALKKLRAASGNDDRCRTVKSTATMQITELLSMYGTVLHGPTPVTVRDATFFCEEYVRIADQLEKARC